MVVNVNAGPDGINASIPSADYPNIHEQFIVNGGAGADYVTIGTFSMSADARRQLSNQVTFNGAAGNDWFGLFAQGSTPVHATLNAASTTHQIGGVTLTNVENISINSTFVNDTVTFTGVRGNSQIDIANYNTFWGAYQTGIATIAFDLRATTQAETFTIDTFYKTVVAGNVEATNFDDIEMKLGTGGDVVQMDLGWDYLDNGQSFSIDAGGGTDTLKLTATASNGFDFGALIANGNNFTNFEKFELTAGAGNNVMLGSAGDDSLLTGTGDDQLTGGGGNDYLDGGSQFDRSPDADHANYTGAFSDYEVVRINSGLIKITDLRQGSPDGIDLVRGIENFNFTDGTRTITQVVAPSNSPKISGTLKAAVVESEVTGDISNANGITALASGRYMLTWVTESNGVSGTDIKARIFNADGTPAGAEFVVNSTTTSDQLTPAIATLANGNVFVAWNSNEGEATNADIRARIFDGNGVALDPDFVVNTIGQTPDLMNKDQYSPDITVMRDGRVLVSWENETPFDGSYAHNPSGSQARFFNSAGAALGEEFVVDTPSHQHYRDYGFVELADGRLIHTHDTAVPTFYIELKFLNADGSPITQAPATTTQFPLNPELPGNNQYPQQLSAAVLTDGRVVTTWLGHGSGSAGNAHYIWAQVRNADGQAEEQMFQVAIAQGGANALNITALANGHFVFTWEEVSANTGNDTYMRVYNSDGTAAGEEFVINTNTAGGQSSPVIAELSDGRLGVSWLSNNNDNTTLQTTVIDLGNVKTTLIPTPPDLVDNETGSKDQTGTALADTLQGDDVANFLAGKEGADTLNGAAGIDTLKGGMGKDKLWGGLGSDTLNGGKGVDKYGYMSAAEGGDIITKFEKGEKFVFDGEAFGFGNYAGKLDADNFKSGKTKKAADAADHFIYRTSDDTLWFDADGKGGAAAVKIADLSNDFDLHAGNILII